MVDKTTASTSSQQEPVKSPPVIKKIWKLFLGGIPVSTTENELEEAIQETNVKSFNSRIFMNQSKSSAGCGAVDVYTMADFETLLNDKISIKNKKLEVKEFINNQNELDKHMEERDKRSLFVGNLGAKINEKDFKSYFSKFGKIEEAYIIYYDETKRQSRGFGFVQYCKEEAALRAVAQQNVLAGRELNVKLRCSHKEVRNSDSVSSHSKSKSSSAHNSGSDGNMMIGSAFDRQGKKYVHSKPVKPKKKEAVKSSTGHQPQYPPAEYYPAHHPPLFEPPYCMMQVQYPPPMAPMNHIYYQQPDIGYDPYIQGDTYYEDGSQPMYEGYYQEQPTQQEYYQDGNYIYQNQQHGFIDHGFVVQPQPMIHMYPNQVYTGVSTAPQLKKKVKSEGRGPIVHAPETDTMSEKKNVSTNRQSQPPAMTSGIQAQPMYGRPPLNKASSSPNATGIQTRQPPKSSKTNPILDDSFIDKLYPIDGDDSDEY